MRQSERATDRPTNRQTNGQRQIQTVQCMRAHFTPGILLSIASRKLCEEKEKEKRKHAPHTPSYSGFMRYKTAAAATLSTNTPTAAVIVVDGECSCIHAPSVLTLAGKRKCTHPRRHLRLHLRFPLHAIRPPTIDNNRRVWGKRGLHALVLL
jgi:hypothetical protein